MHQLMRAHVNAWLAVVVFATAIAAVGAAVTSAATLSRIPDPGRNDSRLGAKHTTRCPIRTHYRGARHRCNVERYGKVHISGHAMVVVPGTPIADTNSPLITAALPGSPSLPQFPDASLPQPSEMPPTSPTNTSLPAIDGSPSKGHVLSASSGTWTESPLSYSYQWQDCNASGASCVSVNGATMSSYELTASDVGHTLRVVVSASNASGSNSAGSAPTATVVAGAPSPPTASFTYAPTAVVVGQTVTFDGTSSSCPDGPCTYAWSDDGGTTRPTPPLWPLGSGQTLEYTFAKASTKYVRLVITDSTGQTATVEHNVVVEDPSPPPSPSNTADCFPKIIDNEECGEYPTKTNTGVEAGVSLTPTTGLVTAAEGQTIEDEKIFGEVLIEHNNVTLKNDEIIIPKSNTVGGVKIGGSNRKGVVIEHVTLHAQEQGGEDAIYKGFNNEGSAETAPAKYLYDQAYWVGQAVSGGNAIVEDSFIDVNAEIPASRTPHYDGIIANDGGVGKVIHNTILMPHSQTSPLILLQNGGGYLGEWTIENNFIAGGGYIAYLGPAKRRP